MVVILFVNFFFFFLFFSEFTCLVYEDDTPDDCHIVPVSPSVTIRVQTTKAAL